MKVLLIVLGVLFLIGCIPVGVLFRYHGEIELKLTVLFFKLGILPKKPLPRKKREKAEAKKAAKDAKKAEAKEKKKKKKQAESLIAKPKPEKPKEKKPLTETVAQLIPWAKLGARFVGEFFHRKLTVKRLWICAALAGGDPAKTAETVGKAWEAIGIAVPILEQAFRIKEKKIAVWPDFTAKKTELEAELQIRLRIGGVVLLLLKYAGKAIVLFLREKKKSKQRKAERKLEQKSVESSEPEKTEKVG